MTDPWRLIAWAMLAFLVVFVALPLLDLAKDSFVGERSGAIGFDNYVTFFSSIISAGHWSIRSWSPRSARG